MNEFTEVIGKRNYVLQCKLPSYVKVFLEENSEGGYFVHKVCTTHKSCSSGGDAGSCSPADISDLDLTGSPLKFSYYSVKCDETTIVQQNEWLSDEENHVGLSQQEGWSLLSHFFLKMPSGERPLWVVCDGQDGRSTLLLAGHKMEGRLSRTVVEYCGLFPVDSAEMNPHAMRHQHTRWSSAQHSVRTEVFCSYFVFESTAIGGNQALDNSVVDSNIRVEVNLKWNMASFHPVDEQVAAVLNVRVNIGHYNSEMLSLWEQLCLLQCLMETRSAAEAERRQPVLPRVVGDGFVAVREQVLQSLQGASWYRPPWSRDQTDTSEEYAGLTQAARDTASAEVPELTGRLWMALAGRVNITELMDCLELVFREVQSHHARPYVRPNNQSTVAQVVLGLMKDKGSYPKLTGLVALEFLIEMGLEKLSQDYLGIFTKSGLGSVDQPPGEGYQHTLIWLTTLHSTLEILLAVQPHFNFPRVCLYSLAQQVITGCSKLVPSLNTLKANPQLALSLSVPYLDVKNRLPSHFSRWRLSLKTDTGLQQLTSVFLCTSSFIFPPGVFCTDTSVFENDKEQYYLFRLTCWSDKMA